MRQQTHKLADKRSKPYLLEAMYFRENDDATVAMLLYTLRLDTT